MKFREKLADWISGGAVTRATDDAESAWHLYSETISNWSFSDAQAREQSHKTYVLQERLNRIAAMETPNANATVKRMAKLAREELK